MIIITSKCKNVNVNDSLLYPGLIQLAPFVKKLDNARHQINLYPLDRDLSGGYCYLTFEQLGNGVQAFC